MNQLKADFDDALVMIELADEESDEKLACGLPCRLCFRRIEKRIESLLFQLFKRRV